MLSQSSRVRGGGANVGELSLRLARRGGPELASRQHRVPVTQASVPASTCRHLSGQLAQARKTGSKRKPYHKKRKYELGRPAASTKIGPRRIHTVRVRGGNKKYHALRLEVGNFSWGSECCTGKTRIIDVVYNASNNELVRTKTLVKNCIVLIDSTPNRQWYEFHYALPLGRKKGAKLTPEEAEILNKKRSKKIQKKYDERKKNAQISSLLEEQFQQGKLLACIASRSGQCGRADGYVLEGKELEFYLRKIKALERQINLCFLSSPM
ncbi:40S ribosomal protein [Saguinus oedipus]|uniref:40S ribosomal protein S8 n=1 Tax=Saguinus oedipus TaxID=9490 RepID=A0ABQ9WJ73_SAGOE|nr:40S ribosomal protein [Saguinus oedipus]